jgi:16S rRNA (guanine527-N7)-methyltransferase
VLDVGSGGGLPGVVLAITCPGWDVTCVDTVGKKAMFVRQVAAELGCPTCIPRTPGWRRCRLPAFDLITSRAFASLADFVRLTRERCWRRRCLDGDEGQAPGRRDRGAAAGDDVSRGTAARAGLDAERCLVWMRKRTAA